MSTFMTAELCSEKWLRWLACQTPVILAHRRLRQEDAWTKQPDCALKGKTWQHNSESNLQHSCFCCRAHGLTTPLNPSPDVATPWNRPHPGTGHTLVQARQATLFHFDSNIWTDSLCPLQVTTPKTQLETDSHLPTPEACFLFCVCETLYHSVFNLPTKNRVTPLNNFRTIS